MRIRAAIYGLLVAAVVACSTVMDRPIAEWVHAHGWDDKHHDWISHSRETIKLAGFYPITILLSVVVAWVHRERWRAALFLLIATVPACLNEPIKLLTGRLRPYKGWNDTLLEQARPFAFHPLGVPLNKVFKTHNLSFPSGHAALAFATAAALSILFPRGRVVWFSVAVTVGIERVTGNAHWCSDVAVGALLGVAGVKLVTYFRSGLLGFVMERADGTLV